MISVYFQLFAEMSWEHQDAGALKSFVLTASCRSVYNMLFSSFNTMGEVDKLVSNVPCKVEPTLYSSA